MKRKQGEPMQVVVEGMGLFESYSAAGRALGVKWDTVRAAAKAGNIEGLKIRACVPNDARGRSRSAVRLDGFVFPSIRSAATYLGISGGSNARAALLSRGAVIIDPPEPTRPEAVKATPTRPAPREILADAARALMDAGRLEDAARVLEMAVQA